MSNKIEIVERGRGAQLSTSRITVQDLVPYFQEGCTREEIIRAIPSLTCEEIAVVERYFLDHKDVMLEQDRCIRDRAAARRSAPDVEAIERKERQGRLESAREMIRQKKRDQNGNHTSG